MSDMTPLGEAKYSVDELVIQISNVNQCIDDIYGSVCDWFRRIRAHDGNQEIDERRIVLVV